MLNTVERRNYLQAGVFVESDHPRVKAKAKEIVGEEQDPVNQAVLLYNYVRDTWLYNPYKLDFHPAVMKTSNLLDRKYAYCVEKANLLSSFARALRIPSRFGFANVRNHIGTEKLSLFLETDVLVFHGYSELYLEGKWVKATPAFNKSMCEILKVEVLEFTGREDSIFQEYDQKGGSFMEYLHDYGHFDDVPHSLMLGEIKRHYPHLFIKFKIKGEYPVIDFNKA